MKRILLSLILMLSMSVNVFAQEWMTSLEVAKNLAMVQNKFLFVIWEDASYDVYPVLIYDEKGQPFVDDLFANEAINDIIWELFVPVIISESNYETLFNEIDGKRSTIYIDKFNDDSIKIMDVNGNIINTIARYYDYLNIVEFIKTYALDTSFLHNELQNYRAQKDFNTCYRLTSKYIDFAVLVKDEKVKSELITLSNYYLKEALAFVADESPELQNTLEQKIVLQNIKQQLILNKPKKVLRRLRRIKTNEIQESNKELWSFLHYTAYLLTKDEENASAWRSEVSLVNLKKANLIIKNNS